MQAAKAVFNASEGVVFDEAGNVTTWADIRPDCAQWKLNAKDITRVSGKSQDHFLLKQNGWFTFEGHEKNGVNLNASGSTVAVVIKNDRIDQGFHEIFGGAGCGPNAQIRFESHELLMIYPPYNYFVIQNSTDKFHFYIFRAADNTLEVFQDGQPCKHQDNPTTQGKTTSTAEQTHMASVGCWFSKHGLEGRISCVAYFDHAVTGDSFQQLVQDLQTITDKANDGFDFPVLQPKPKALPFGWSNVGATSNNNNPFAFPPLAPNKFPATFATATTSFTFSAPVSVPVPASTTAPVTAVAPGSNKRRKQRSSAASQPVLDTNNSSPFTSLESVLAPLRTMVSTLEGKDMNKALYTIQWSSDTASSATNLHLERCGQGETYHLDREKEEEFQEEFGDEGEIEDVNGLSKVLKEYVQPTIHPLEIGQWISLWCLSDKSPNVISGLVSGEQVNRAYTVRLPWSKDWMASALTVQPTMEGQGQQEVVYPRLFRVLHRDSSQECVSHGEIGVFVHVEDPAAMLLDAQTKLPLYITPLVYGYYPGKTTDLSWHCSLPGTSNAFLKAVLDALYDESSKDTTLGTQDF